MPDRNWSCHNLDPGDAGPALKARAWRALAQIDRRALDPTEASNDLLEALKLTPETPADTLLAANLAEQSGQYDAAETAYRRILSNDPNSAAGQRRPGPPAHRTKQYPEAETLLRAALANPRRSCPDRPTGRCAGRPGQSRSASAASKAPRLPIPRTQPSTSMLAEVLADAGDDRRLRSIYI